MKDKVVLFSPVVLIMSTALVFRVLSLKLGADWATIIGFSFYQLIWCIIFPFAILGKTEVFRLFRKQVDQSAKEILPFILFTLPLGFIYSIVAFRMKSIKWVAIAHSLSGILAFGVPLSTSVANIIGID